MRNETIVDRVVERLKSQPLGDLITEEDLHDIVKQAIPKVFFEKRKQTVGSGYNAQEKELEPAIVEVMRDLLQASARDALKVWMVENADLLAAHWSKVMDAGILSYVQKLQDASATAQVRDALVGVVQTLNSERQKLGLPSIFV